MATGPAPAGFQHFMVPSCTQTEAEGRVPMTSPDGNRLSRAVDPIWVPPGRGTRAEIPGMLGGGAALACAGHQSPVGAREAAAQPGLASMSQRARVGQVATNMPHGSRCDRTFLGTFQLSGLSCPHLKSHR